jgi:hypothetical protein
MKRLLPLLIAALWFAAPANAQVTATLPVTCTPGTPPICTRATAVTNPDGSNIGGGGGGSAKNPTYTAPVAGSSPTSTAATSGQLTGTPIDLQLASGAQLQIAGLNADSLAITQGMAVVSGGTATCTGATYVTATVLKQDLTTTAATALTGTAANGIYSVMVFGGCLKITRTGTADTLTVTYRGTN